MSDKAEVKGRRLSASRQQMVIHPRVDDGKSLGKRDGRSGRYIPISGGSRTRLPVYDDPRIPRYQGFVGVNPSQSEDIYTLPALYAELDRPVPAPAAQDSEIAAPVAAELPTEDGMPMEHAEQEDSAEVPAAQDPEMAAPDTGELPALDDDVPVEHAEDEDSAAPAQDSEFAETGAEPQPKRDDVLYI